VRISGESAYVLHARAWRETSLLVEVLAQEQGRLGLIARGVQGPKRHVLRAALQPMQHIRLDAVLRGELAQLRSAEALDAAPVLQGDASLAAFYVNELVLRLAPRGDPLPELYAAYGELRTGLAGDAPIAWTLRRFERDLLEALGFGLALDEDADGAPIDPAARYRLEPEFGARRVRIDRGQGDRDTAATGRALLALAADTQPDADDLASLRRAMRAVLAHHLGPKGLKSWEMLAELGRVTKGS
jgi:DNA repair protein RecO (recombination protein O)